MPAYILRFALGACAGACMTAMPVFFSIAEAGSSGASNSNDTAPDLVFLSCATDPQSPQQTAVCGALHQALSDGFPAQKFVIIPPSPPPPSAPPEHTEGTKITGPTDEAGLIIVLHITRADSHTIDAHLEWTQTTTAAIIGPTVTLSVLDRPLTATLYPSLAKSLIKNSRLPL